MRILLSIGLMIVFFATCLNAGTRRNRDCSGDRCKPRMEVTQRTFERDVHVKRERIEVPVEVAVIPPPLTVVPATPTIDTPPACGPVDACGPAAEKKCGRPRIVVTVVHAAVKAAKLPLRVLRAR